MTDELPPGWDRAKIGSFLHLVRGASPRPKGDPRYFGGSIPWIMIADVTKQEGKRLTKTREFVTREGASLSRLLPAGTLILTNSATIGVPKILGVEGCIHDGFVAFPNLPPNIDIDYFYEYFRYLRPFLVDRFRQGMTQVNLNTEIVRDLDVLLPPLAEQRRIVAKLDALNVRSRRAKEALDAIPALIEKFKQSVLAAAFRGDLTADWRAKNPDVEPASELLRRIRIERRRRWEEAELAKLKAKGGAPTDDRWKAKYEEPEPVDTSELPDLPEGWCWARLGELGHRGMDAVQTGPFGAQLHNTEFTESGVPVIAVGNLTGTGFSDSALYYVSEAKAQQLSRYDVWAGDVLFARSGATLGKVCVAPTQVKDWRMTGHILRLRLDPTVLLPDIAVFALWGAPAVKSQVESGIRGATRPGYNTTLLENIVVPLMPIAEQKYLVSRITGTFARVQDVESKTLDQLEAVSALDRSILGKAFRGELVPQDPNDEPGSVLLDRIRAERADADDAASNRPKPGRRRARE